MVQVISLIPNAIGRRVFFEEAAKAVDLEVEFLLGESNKLSLKKERRSGFQDGPPPPIPPPAHFDDYTYDLPSEPPPKSHDLDKTRPPHEREFLRILLLHGHKTIADDLVADYLLAKIEAIPFDDPFTTQILELYKAESANNLVELKTFQNLCLEKKLQGLESIFNADYEPSKNWARFSRMPKPYDYNLEKIIETNLKKLEYYYLDFRYREMATNITEPDSEKIQELEQLVKQRRELGKALKFMF